MSYLNLSVASFEVKWIAVCFLYFFYVFKDVHCHQNLHNATKFSSSEILLSLLRMADVAIHSAKEYEVSRIKFDTDLFYPMDCAEIFAKNASAKSGIYKIWIRSRIIQGPVNVFCDMEDDGGAWTVLQRRGDFDSAKDYFYRDWKSYKSGFGDPIKDFWIGNDIVFSLTNERANALKFSLSDWEGNSTYAVYDSFWMDAENQNYSVHVEGYRGTAGDAFSITNGVPFTTQDKDNDKHDSNCAVMFKGAWWYTSCHSSNLNGLYLKGPHKSYADGVEWSPFRGQNYSLKDTVMKIRPKDFVKNIALDITPQ